VRFRGNDGRVNLRGCRGRCGDAGETLPPARAWGSVCTGFGSRLIRFGSRFIHSRSRFIRFGSPCTGRPAALPPCAGCAPPVFYLIVSKRSLRNPGILVYDAPHRIARSPDCASLIQACGSGRHGKKRRQKCRSCTQGIEQEQKEMNRDFQQKAGQFPAQRH
jgi:hypothetical protein